MSSLTVLPPYPVPGRQCTLAFGVAAGTNHVKVWVTNAPKGSALRQKLDASTEERLPFHFGEVLTPLPFTPDRGGVYTFVIREYLKGASSFGGTYEGDPLSNETETETAISESTLTLQIGQKVTQKVGKSPDTATLTLWIWGDTIRPTSIEVHGEKTPSLLASSTPKAGIAAENPGVQELVEALENAEVATALGDVGAIVSNLCSTLNLHLGTTADGVHSEADTQNQIPAGAFTSVSPKDLAATISKVLVAEKHHYTNDDNGKTPDVVPGPDSAGFHQLTGNPRNDTINLPIFDSVGDLETGYGAIADAWRSYEAHRVNADVHGTPDLTHALDPLPLVLSVHEAFISQLASIAPTVPPTINSGVVTAVSRAGFKES